MNWLLVNRIVAALMAAILLVSAVRGFTGVSQSRPYDMFHLIFAVIGLVSVFVASGRAAPAFNLIFGLIDAYLALAQRLGLFPTQLFNLTPSDTVQHIVIAVVLVGVSVVWFVRTG